MSKSPKKPKVGPDLAQTTFRVVQEATGQAPKMPDPDAGKDPAAVARGRKGGVKGRKAHEEVIRTAQSVVARETAEVPWGRSPKLGLSVPQEPDNLLRFGLLPHRQSPSRWGVRDSHTSWPKSRGAGHQF